MQTTRHVPDRERRARLGARHALIAPYVPDAVAATEAMTVLHATEPATVYLSLWARVPDLTVGDVDRVLYDDRRLVKQLAMRRTLFVFPRDLLPATLGSASARVEAQQRQVIAKDIERHRVAADGTAWLQRAAEGVLRRLADGSALSAKQLREELPELAGRTLHVEGDRYGGAVSFAPRVLTYLGAGGRVVRGPNAGHWRTSRPLWTAAETWLGALVVPLPEREGYAELVRRWLRTFGPGTVKDLQWWLGGTVAVVKRALADVGAVTVSLDGGGTGHLLPDDLDPVPDPDPWVALLPTLDPTVMGWKERDFYLGPHAPALFDANGNAGTTAWVDGRIVGCWVQGPDGAVVVSLLEDVSRAARAALTQQAERLTAWLGETRVNPVYVSPAMRAAGGAQDGA